MKSDSSPSCLLPRVLLTAACLTVINSQAAVRVPLSVQESSGIARVAEPVRSGVPIPKSEQLFSTASLRMVAPGGVPVPARFTVLGRWNAGPNDASAPIRWVLVDFLADAAASGAASYTLTDEGAGPALPAVAVTESATDITVTTGPGRFVISKVRGTLLDAAWLDMDGDGSYAANEQIVVPAVDAGPFVVSGGMEYRGANTAPLSAIVEDHGPGRVTVRVEGFTRDGTTNTLLRYVTRLTFFAGRTCVQVNHTIIDGRVIGGASSWDADFQQTVIDRAGLRLRVALAGAPTARVFVNNATPQIIPLGPGASAAIRQRTPVDWRLPLAYEVHAGASLVENGSRAEQAWLDLADNRWGLAVSTRDFWRKGPQRLAAAADGTVTVEFPSEPYKIYQAMGWMEELVLYFHTPTNSGASLRATMVGQLQDPLFAVAPAAWYVGSGAFGELSVAPSAQYPRYDQVMEELYQQTVAWIEEGHAFGLLNWLDMPSDRWDGSPNDQVTWGNSYYDAPQAQIREFARRGEYRWLRDLAFPQIRHWFTTDCFDGDELAWRFNGISMMRGAYHRTVFTGEYHYMESLWDYYYLTGDRRALERGLQAARTYATAGAWANPFDGGLATGTLTLRIFAQKLNTLVEAVMASGDSALRAKLVSDAEDFMTFVASPEGFFKNSRQLLTTYNSEQAFMVVVLAAPALWKYHQLTCSPQAREKLIVLPQRILRAHRMSTDPASPDFLRFYNSMRVTATGGGNFTATPNLATGTTDDYMYDPGVQALVTALCRAAQLNGDRALVAEARGLFERRLLPGWFATPWDKPAAQQTLRAAAGLALLEAPNTPAAARIDRGRWLPDRFRLQLGGTFGHAYVVQVTTNFVNWTSISTNAPAPNGFLEVDDTSGSGADRRFFRIIANP